MTLLPASTRICDEVVLAVFALDAVSRRGKAIAPNPMALSPLDERMRGRDSCMSSIAIKKVRTSSRDDKGIVVREVIIGIALMANSTW